MRSSTYASISLLLYSLFVLVLPKVQAQGSVGRSPKLVVSQLLNLEMNGAVLAPHGREKMSRLFLRHNPLAKDGEILVISSNYEVDLDSLNQKRATVYIGYIELGTIKSDFQWHPPSPAIMKFASMYHLVFGDTYWETTTTDVQREFTGPTRWRIDAQGPIRVRVFSKATAIRYVTEMRDQMADPAIKSNADRTLTILRKLKE